MFYKFELDAFETIKKLPKYLKADNISIDAQIDIINLSVYIFAFISFIFVLDLSFIDNSGLKIGGSIGVLLIQILHHGLKKD